jgi:hypothetical protein
MHILKFYLSNLAYKLLLALKKVGKSIEDKTKYTAKHNLHELQQLELAISAYENQLRSEETTEGVLMLTNMLHYAEKQAEKSKLLSAFLQNIAANELKGRDKDLDKFISSKYLFMEYFDSKLSFPQRFSGIPYA